MDFQCFCDLGRVFGQHGRTQRACANSQWVQGMQGETILNETWFSQKVLQVCFVCITTVLAAQTKHPKRLISSEKWRVKLITRKIRNYNSRANVSKQKPSNGNSQAKYPGANSETNDRKRTIPIEKTQI